MLICNHFFPHKNKKPKMLENIALIGIGANLKNPIKTFISLFIKMQKNNNIALISSSPIYKNPPFGYANQNDFYNATLLFSTNLRLLELYALIFYLERIYGRARKRAFKNAPRMLDIDMLFYNDVFLRSKKLNLPHPHWDKRASVLVPLLFQVNYKGF